MAPVVLADDPRRMKSNVASVSSRLSPSAEVPRHATSKPCSTSKIAPACFRAYEVEQRPDRPHRRAPGHDLGRPTGDGGLQRGRVTRIVIADGLDTQHGRPPDSTRGGERSRAHARRRRRARTTRRRCAPRRWRRAANSQRPATRSLGAGEAGERSDRPGPSPDPPSRSRRPIAWSPVRAMGGPRERQDDQRPRDADRTLGDHQSKPAEKQGGGHPAPPQLARKAGHAMSVASVAPGRHGLLGSIAAATCTYDALSRATGMGTVTRVTWLAQPMVNPRQHATCLVM
jgi:hypothetical protein